MSYHSPADVLRHALIGAGVGVLRSQNADDAAWPIYTNHLPDKPDNAVCTYNTQGRADGRLMRSGETQRHPGWQIKLRGTATDPLWAKARAIQTALDGMRQIIVVIGAESYTLASVTQSSDVLSMGQETESKRREQLTINGTLTITKNN